MRLSDGVIVMTRHMPMQLPKFKHATEGRHMPVGCELTRPFPDARVLFIEHRDSWLYVYWISSTVTYPEGYRGTPD